MNKLKDYFIGREDVEVAYLFGSQALDSVSPLSDVDVAVVFKKSLSMEERFNAKLGLINDLTSLSGSNRVDVVELDDARLLLKYNIIKDGILLKTSDVRARVEYMILDEYLDRRYYDVLHSERFLERVSERGLS